MKPRSKRVARPQPPPFHQLRTHFPSPFSQPRFRGPTELPEASLSPRAYSKGQTPRLCSRSTGVASSRLKLEYSPGRSCCPHWSDAGSGRSLLSLSLSEGKPAREGPALPGAVQGWALTTPWRLDMDFSSATMVLSRHERKKQAKTLCKVLTKHKVGMVSRPHHSPKPAVLAGCKSPAEQEKPIGNFNFSCSVPDRQD